MKNIQSFGAFIEILPGQDGLLHISEIDWRRLNTVEEVLKVGDEVEVKLIDVDSKTGKLKLSRKVLLPKPPQKDGNSLPVTGRTAVVRVGAFLALILVLLATAGTVHDQLSEHLVQADRA